jgi:hypothetical protein
MTVPLRLCIAEIEIAFGDVRFFPLFLAKFFGKSYRYTLQNAAQHLFLTFNSSSILQTHSLVY